MSNLQYQLAAALHKALNDTTTDLNEVLEDFDIPGFWSVNLKDDATFTIETEDSQLFVVMVQKIR